MSYQHPLLGQALAWKFNHPPVTTMDGQLLKWHTDPWPTDQELDQWVREYLAYKLTDTCKDDELQRFIDHNGGKPVKALVLLLIEKGVLTLAEIRAKYRSL